mgnify:CR=1 FL=1
MPLICQCIVYIFYTILPHSLAQLDGLLNREVLPASVGPFSIERGTRFGSQIEGEAGKLIREMVRDLEGGVCVELGRRQIDEGSSAYLPLCI